MAEFLFEILSEEIPARMQVRAGADLSKALTAGLEKAGLTVDNAKVLTGPRRLAFIADLPLRSPDVSEERKGPRVGSPERALEGFMKAAGLSDISEAEIRTDPKKGEYYVAVMESAGRNTDAILQELIPDVMNSFPWPKSMKSGGSNFRWVRPLRGLIVIFGGAVVEVEVGGITSSNMTVGHRRHGPGPFVISSFKDYTETLEGKGHVIVSHEARKAVIVEKARSLCAEKGLELVEDEGLLNEVAGLTEWPVVLLGVMDPEFLTLPDEVIRLTLKSHQKTFTVRDPKTGNLAAHFIIVANQIAPDGGEAIKAGNGKVISARLSDAVFFQTEDAKKNLIDYYDKLDTVVFHKKLGTIRDKAERVAALAKELAPKVGADPEKAELAAKLSKCDLVTQTVIEATSLQGQIGRLMYEREGGDASVATAIEEHYKPQGPSDAVPTDPVAIAVALADKLDTLAGFWAIDEKPTGSKDPFALRRAALGVVRIILENEVRLKLEPNLWGASAELPNSDKIAAQIDSIKLEGSIKSEPFKEASHARAELDIYSTGEYISDLLAFILDRLKVYLRDKGIRHDIIDAGLTEGQDDLVSIVNRVTALQSFLETDDGENLLAGYKRAANILKAEAKKGELPTGEANRPSDEYGAALFDALKSSKPKITDAVYKEDYSNALTNLANLRAPIDAFFTHTQIISDDTAVRENNLRLLGMISDTSRQIADFEAIQG
ncbi:MAG: glycine--tRNA ligase subunit beta [Litorimonas sp.]